MVAITKALSHYGSPFLEIHWRIKTIIVKGNYYENMHLSSRICIRINFKLIFFLSYVYLVIPSVLEHGQTALRDPAFYMIWKRVLNLFKLWHEQLPPYTREELALSSVVIENVEVDKFVTYFENTYTNINAGIYR